MPFWNREPKDSAKRQDTDHQQEQKTSNPDPDPQHPSTGVGHTTSGGGSGGGAAAAATQHTLPSATGTLVEPLRPSPAEALQASIEQNVDANPELSGELLRIQLLGQQVKFTRRGFLPAHLSDEAIDRQVQEHIAQRYAELETMKNTPQERVNYGSPPPTFQDYIEGGKPPSYEEHQRRQRQQQQQQQQKEEEGKKPSPSRGKGPGMR